MWPPCTRSTTHNSAADALGPTEEAGESSLCISVVPCVGGSSRNMLGHDVILAECRCMEAEGRAMGARVAGELGCCWLSG